MILMASFCEIRANTIWQQRNGIHVPDKMKYLKQN